jgi:signal transduction histidine kinase
LIGTFVALLLMYVFVERNVLQRLRSLGRSIQRLTDGEIERPVPQSGNDELSKMAAVLEAFRRNALLLRHKETVLKARTEELEQVNQELDRFAHIASHDLKAPLRAIDSLAGFLREDLGDTVPEESRNHIDLMQGRVRRLDRLLDSLLEYSRVGRMRAPPETIDLREILEACIDLAVPEGAQVQMTGSFGRVCTWRTPLEQIVQNLVDNAFKHDNIKRGLVSIDCEVRNKFVHLIVSDQGPGIAPEFQQRIFAMFETLKPRDTVEGSGMGLAILKKAVDVYGGSIAVESNPAEKQGTRFILRWPTVAVISDRNACQTDIPSLESCN